MWKPRAYTEETKPEPAKKRWAYGPIYVDPSGDPEIHAVDDETGATICPLAFMTYEGKLAAAVGIRDILNGEGYDTSNANWDKTGGFCRIKQD